MKSLNDYIILNTRPADQAFALTEALQNLGARVISLPTITIVENTSKPTVLSNDESADYAIFASANAVPFAKKYWKDIQTKIIAIGSGTAQALRVAGFSVDLIPENFSSEGVLALPELNNVQGKKIILFCGESGRTLLADALKIRGAEIKICACYKRDGPTLLNDVELAQLIKADINLIISTSCESLNNLYQMVGTGGRCWLLNTPLLVISPRMQALAKELKFNAQCLLANNASNIAIIEKLLQPT